MKAQRTWERKGGKRTKEQRESDKSFCAELFVKGYSYKQIAEKLNERTKQNGLDYTISIQQIYTDINNILASWKKERFDCIDKYMQLELKRLDKMEVELWEAWERSKEPKRKTQIRGGSILNTRISGGILDKRELKDENGDPRYLDLLLKVQERRAKLLGYNAPLKVSVYNEQPTDENPANAKYDINKIPLDMVVDMAYKLQDAEYNKRQEESKNGKETD